MVGSITKGGAPAAARVSALAPFRIRAFRYQWPADLATSWAFEMELIILGWYVLVETQSVLLLTLFASLQHLGTLVSPFFGVMGDRFGHRNVLCAMRGFYALLAATLMTLTFTGLVTPAYVLVIAGLLGLVRPSDIGMRVALVGDTLPAAQLVGAMGIQRTTQDSARVAGALTGAGLVAALGMGWAYVVVTALYSTSVLLTLRAGSARRAAGARAATPPAAAAPSLWRDLKEGMAYVWRTPHLLAMMCLAFLLNGTAFPQQNGLMPYVAKEVYLTDQTGLGYLVAGLSSGALFASIIMSRQGGSATPGRTMVLASAAWYVFLLLFAHAPHYLAGIAILFLAGCSQSVGQVPMAAMLLRTTEEQFRGRVQGIRMLMIYSNVPGLLLAGELIPRIGYRATVMLYCATGLVGIAFVMLKWGAHLWSRDAPVNVR
ncbi:MAG TPA: MFS transporter [Burkholderiales bacterium]|nr:MFS transporter [Burkholderiales bacterium]